MKRNLLPSLVAAATLSLSGAAIAGGDVSSELQMLKQRIADLEAQQNQNSAQGGNWTDRVSVGGVAEFLATASDEDGNKTNDIDVDTVELTIDAQVNDFIAVSTTLKYEDDPEGSDDFSVDEAIVVVGGEDSPLTLTAGKTGVPFAVINGGTWTDPLTDDFTDNTDDVAILTASNGGLSADLYVFKGDQDNDDTVENFGINLGFESDSGFAVGAGYLNNIGNTEPFGSSEKVNALRLNAAFETGALALSGEYIQADSFDTAAGAEPRVVHISADYGLDNVFGAAGNLAFGYSETDEAQFIDLAESRTILALSRELGENAEVIVEYVREEGYGGEETDTLNLVLATSF
ncbi:MAG: LbtU family siderophore porin [Marinobacterium sp.]|nr:LbtU family siderophore porin [Marinobacterium sp.]